MVIVESRSKKFGAKNLHYLCQNIICLENHFFFESLISFCNFKFSYLVGCKNKLNFSKVTQTQICFLKNIPIKSILCNAFDIFQLFKTFQ